MNLAIHTLRCASQEAMTSEQARRLLETGGQLVDISSPEEFRREALPGAVNLPVDAMNYDYANLNRGRPVILYAKDGIRCTRAARLLAGRGFSQIYQLSAH